MGLSFYDAMDKYLEEIKEDYAQNMLRSEEKLTETQLEIAESMIKEFNDGLSFKLGKKYAKVITNRSVHSFVVYRHDDKKFQCGDILMAASWSSPTRNKSRGSIYRNDKRVSWTGAY